MVPKETPWGGERISRFGTILFDMVPKVLNVTKGAKGGFGTILFDMVPKGYNTKRI